MKNKLRLTAFAIISLIMAMFLTSCGDADVPDNMQLVAGGENIGYYFYGPEGWVIANQGDISCTYVSSIDYSSATVASLGENALAKDKTLSLAVAELFEKEIEKFQREPFADFNLTKSGEKCTFGNAEEAYKFIYSYKYESKSYTCMQIIATYKGRSYIFTYNASSETYRDEKSFYQFYLTDYIQKIIDNFKFIEIKATVPADAEYEKDADGNILVSDKNKCGFDLWVNPKWSVDYSTAIVSVSLDDGTNINVCELINNTVSIKDNYINKKEQLTALSDKTEGDDGTQVSSFVEIIGINKDEDGNEYLSIIDLDNARSAAEFEYKYTLFGKTYHVYQVFVVNGYMNMEAFVYTFTAEEANYAEHIEEAKSILNKIGY